MELKFSYFLVHCRWYLRSLWYCSWSRNRLFVILCSLKWKIPFPIQLRLVSLLASGKYTFNILNTRSIYSCIKAISIVGYFIFYIFILGCILVLCSLLHLFITFNAMKNAFEIYNKGKKKQCATHDRSNEHIILKNDQ